MRCVVCDGGLRAAVRDAAGYTLELHTLSDARNPLHRKEKRKHEIRQRGPRRDAQPLHATPLAAVLFPAPLRAPLSFFFHKKENIKLYRLGCLSAPAPVLGHVAVRGAGGGGLEYESGRTGRHRAWSGHLLFPLSVPAATRHGLPNEAIAAFANCTNSKPQPSAFQAQQGWGGDSSRSQRAGDRHGDACFGRVQNASPRCMTAGLTPGACVQIEAT